ncbi:MAG: hypothetical protein PWR20_2382 [Bacteroidales bacterium]|jgi:hypothetical protein|nr:hypothetical protein [Bacteroidales bacterium]MDN5330625.1 hypothetical protein [Bacteroidales bacterium]
MKCRGMMHGLLRSRHMINKCFWFQVPGSGFQVPGSKFQVPGSKFQVPGSKFLVQVFVFVNGLILCFLYKKEI